MNNKVLVIIIAIAVVLVGGYLLYNSGPVVSAQGSSSIKASPDEVSVYINVETKNQSAQGAQEMNKEISDKLLFELVKIGFDRDELKFVNQNVYEDVDWRTGAKKGFVVSQQLVVKTDKTEKVPSIVDAVIQSGALVSYINFELSDEKQGEYKKQALEEASKDAMEKARAIADGQGRRLGRLVSLENQEAYYPGPIGLYAKAEGMDSAMANSEARKVALNIAPQDLEITASIMARYKLSLI